MGKERPDWPESRLCWLSPKPNGRAVWHARGDYGLEHFHDDYEIPLGAEYLRNAIPPTWESSNGMVRAIKEGDLTKCTLRSKRATSVGYASPVRLSHPGEFPRMKSSQWHSRSNVVIFDTPFRDRYQIIKTAYEYSAHPKTYPFEIDITFMSEADVQPELILREAFDKYCPGLPNNDKYGWLTKGVPASPPPAPVPTLKRIKNFLRRTCRIGRDKYM